MSHEFLTNLVTTALKNAEGYGTSAEIASGIVDALGRMRIVVEEQAGYAAAGGLDTLIRTAVLSAAAYRNGVTVPLPAERGPGARRVAAMIQDAVMTGLMVTYEDALPPRLDRLVQTLIVALIELIGGAPDYSQLAERVLRRIEIADYGAEPPVSHSM